MLADPSGGNSSGYLLLKRIMVVCRIRGPYKNAALSRKPITRAFRFPHYQPSLRVRVFMACSPHLDNVFLKFSLPSVTPPPPIVQFSSTVVFIAIQCFHISSVLTARSF